MAQQPHFEYRKNGLRLNRIVTVAVVVMAICVVLFPVLVRAKSKLTDSSCASNLRQIGMALRAYAADNDERFPAAVDPSDKALPAMWAAQPKFAAKVKAFPLLQDVLLPYMKSREVFHCPSDNGGLVMENGLGRGPLSPFVSAPSMFANYGTSYLFRTEIVFQSLSHKGYWPGANVGVLFDGYGQWHGGTEALNPSTDFRRQLAMANTYRYNVLYGDDHVQSLNFDDLQATWSQKL